MARDRYQPGVYQINNPDASNTKKISVDNQTIIVGAGTSQTIIVYNQLSFDTGKVEATWIGRNQKDVTGNVVVNT